MNEPISMNAPRPRGKKEVILCLFVDLDHAGEQLARRSRTGFIVYMNMAPILWYSKRQGTVETCVFGAEFVAMKVGNEACCEPFMVGEKKLTVRPRPDISVSLLLSDDVRGT
jgi:hypothetical protein